MAAADERVEELKNLLTEELGNSELDDELEKYLKKNFIEAIETFQKHLTDCRDNIKKLDDYAALRTEVKRISKQKRRRFYIGYTHRLSTYLWDTTPKSERYKEQIAAGELVKRTTYYIHRDNEGDGDESDDIEIDDGELESGDYESDDDGGDADDEARDAGDEEDDDEGEDDETEAALISEFGEHQRCLNGNHKGTTSQTGMIYVLEYEKKKKK